MQGVKGEENFKGSLGPSINICQALNSIKICT